MTVVPKVNRLVITVIYCTFHTFILSIRSKSSPYIYIGQYPKNGLKYLKHGFGLVSYDIEYQQGIYNTGKDT